MPSESWAAAVERHCKYALADDCLQCRLNASVGPGEMQQNILRWLTQGESLFVPLLTILWLCAHQLRAKLIVRSVGGLHTKHGRSRRRGTSIHCSILSTASLPCRFRHSITTANSSREPHRWCERRTGAGSSTSRPAESIGRSVLACSGVSARLRLLTHSWWLTEWCLVVAGRHSRATIGRTRCNSGRQRVLVRFLRDLVWLGGLGCTNQPLVPAGTLCSRAVLQPTF